MSKTAIACTHRIIRKTNKHTLIGSPSFNKCIHIYISINGLLITEMYRRTSHVLVCDWITAVPSCQA